MTETSSSAFALAELRSSMQRFSGWPISPAKVYELGRLCEARILIAQGVALGVYPAQEALNLLKMTDRRLARVKESVADDDFKRLPTTQDADQLLQIWDGKEYTAEARRQFSRT